MTEYEAHADTPYLQVERFTEPLTQTMVKIDEQMRKADTLPEGTIKQQYTAALQEDAQRVSKQLSILENNRAELMPVSYTHLDVYKRQQRYCGDLL